MPMLKWEKFDEPKSWEDAQVRRINVIAEIQEIEAQFGNPDRKTELGEAKYWSWRQKAKWARTLRLEELRMLNYWLKTEATEEDASA